VWRPFLLNPELKDGSLDRTLYLERVFGSKSRIKQFYEAIDIAGKTVGINFNIENSENTPSSVDAHSVILHAEKKGKAIQMANVLYTAYFTNAQDIGNSDILTDLAVSIGLEADDVQEVLDNPNRYDEIYDDNTQIHRLGINGVPSYIFAGKNIISGAQEPETLLHMIDFTSTLNVDAHE
jgi:predicted DsbA family dithiol-disulfide isomerase